MKNLVYIVAINFDVKDHAIKSWEAYCKRIGADFKVISDSSVEGMAPHWERYTVIERYPDYENYLYVDADALVKWNAPNFFETLNEDCIYAVKDIGSLEWTENSIRGYQDLFVDTKVNWWEYFTTGFLRFNKSHREFFKSFIDFEIKHQTELNRRQYETLRKGFDQTPFNYFVKQQGAYMKILPEVYSLGHLIKKDIFYNGMFIELGYIWQFNGLPHSERESVMNQIWNHVKEMYE